MDAAHENAGDGSATHVSTHPLPLRVLQLPTAGAFLKAAQHPVGRHRRRDDRCDRLINTRRRGRSQGRRGLGFWPGCGLTFAHDDLDGASLLPSTTTRFIRFLSAHLRTPHRAPTPPRIRHRRAASRTRRSPTGHTRISHNTQFISSGRNAKARGCKRCVRPPGFTNRSLHAHPTRHAPSTQWCVLGAIHRPDICTAPARVPRRRRARRPLRSRRRRGGRLLLH